MRKRHFRSNYTISLLVLLISFAFTLCGCGAPKAKRLWENNLSEIYHLEIYAYDGETGDVYYMYNGLQEEIVEKISKVSIKEAVDWTHEDMTFPIYGMKCNDYQGNSFEIAWSDGYGIAADGTVYTFAYDFEKLIADYEWDAQYDFEWASLLPCAKALSVGEEGWITEMLNPAKDLNAPDGISMELTKQAESALTIELTNNRTEEWIYGTHYSVQVLLDDVWYNIPTEPGFWAFQEIAKIHPPGVTYEETCDLTMYGELPAGTYRLVREGMTAVFEIVSSDI